MNVRFIFFDGLCIAVGLIFPAKLQIGISILSGLGSLGYGIFWLIAAILVPGMGPTGVAKETIGLLAQVSAGSFYIAAVGLFITLGYRIFMLKEPEFHN